MTITKKEEVIDEYLRGYTAREIASYVGLTVPQVRFIIKTFCSRRREPEPLLPQLLFNGPPRAAAS